MEIRDLQQYSEIRPKARAYFCYLFSKNLPNHNPSISIDAIMGRMRKIKGDLRKCEGVYLLDDKGIQLTPTYAQEGELDNDIGRNRSTRAYYYRAMKEQRCTITDPYPSLITKELTITASQPIFCENGDIRYVACLDMSLDEVLKIAHPMAIGKFYGRTTQLVYAAFSMALALIALLLFIKAGSLFFKYGFDFKAVAIKDIFESTILLTLALAIMDLVKTLFEEEVIGRDTHEDSAVGTHKTMVRFLGSIIIALSIEALMLVFKFAMTAPDMLVNAIYIIGGVSLLLIGLAVYIKFTKKSLEK